MNLLLTHSVISFRKIVRIVIIVSCLIFISILAAFYSLKERPQLQPVVADSTISAWVTQPTEPVHFGIILNERELFYVVITSHDPPARYSMVKIGDHLFEAHVRDLVTTFEVTTHRRFMIMVLRKEGKTDEGIEIMLLVPAKKLMLPDKNTLIAEME